MAKKKYPQKSALLLLNVRCHIFGNLIVLSVRFRSLASHTAKNYHLLKVVENRMQQCCAAHIVHSCQQYCPALLHLIAG